MIELRVEGRYESVRDLCEALTFYAPPVLHAKSGYGRAVFSVDLDALGVGGVEYAEELGMAASVHAAVYSGEQVFSFACDAPRVTWAAGCPRV